ncbi:MAG: lipase [Lachnospiraceae bacterium]|nr:lipase [Lachnospiraceae bacterium]
MKKVLTIIGITILCIVILIVILLVYLSTKPAITKDYIKKIETGGDIEAKYLGDGAYEVSYYEEAAMQVFEKYEIYYPKELETGDKAYPVIVVCNGTGWKASKSKPIYEHYASWGFIVIATEETHSWNAFGAEMCVVHLQRLNDNQMINDRENIFYQKIDFDNVGIIGHSQGGVGVINAITNTEHKNTYKTAIALSPTNQELAETLEWPYNAARINIPIMLISGEGGGDDWVVTGEGLTTIYDDIPADKVMSRRKNTDHGKTQYSEDGYVMAWFMWQLQGDEEAAKAFIGDNPEIMNNKWYQDQRIDYPE